MAFYETKETHRKEALRTRYYHGSYEEVKNAVLKVALDFGFQVTDVNDTHHEILLDGSSSIVVTITSASMYEQGVDFNVMTAYAFDFGFGKRLITKLYTALGKYVRLKGVSLHPWLEK